MADVARDSEANLVSQAMPDKVQTSLAASMLHSLRIQGSEYTVDSGCQSS